MWLYSVSFNLLIFTVFGTIEFFFPKSVYMKSIVVIHNLILTFKSRSGVKRQTEGSEVVLTFFQSSTQLDFSSSEFLIPQFGFLVWQCKLLNSSHRSCTPLSGIAGTTKINLLPKAAASQPASCVWCTNIAVFTGSHPDAD